MLLLFGRFLLADNRLIFRSVLVQVRVVFFCLVLLVVLV